MPNNSRRPVIAIIGSATEPPAPQIEAMAIDIAHGVVDRGCRIVTGGMSGVMRAASAGARQSEACGDSSVIGVLPGYDRSTANEHVQVVIPTGMQLGRNVVVVAMADVVVAIGGGAGTLSEIAMAWQLGKPIVAMKALGGWSQEMSGLHLDHRGKLAVQEATTASEAVEIIVRLLAELQTEPGDIGSGWRGGRR